MFDLIILVIILVSGFFAFFRGFSLELLSITGWVISFLGSYLYGNNLINIANKYINNILISTTLSYVVIFVIIFSIFTFLTRKFSFFIKKSYLGILDKSLGFIFGLLRGYVLVGLSFFAFDYFYQGKRIDFIEKSKIIPVIKITNNSILRLMKIDTKYSKKLSDEIKKKSDSLFEKSIDSKLRLKQNNNTDKNKYNNLGRKNIETIIENNLE
ncbi:MAG: CvpA family protein [Alphaproteobacteria bacterium]|tara:strand:- start:1706 stop:2341 length:636 start_codon:yes stop_codon:yes gene_type:complete